MSDYNIENVSTRPWEPKIQYHVWADKCFEDEDGEPMKDERGIEISELFLDKDEFGKFYKERDWDDCGWDYHITLHDGLQTPKSWTFYTGNAPDNGGTTNYPMGFHSLDDFLHAVECVNAHDTLQAKADLLYELLSDYDLVYGVVNFGGNDKGITWYTCRWCEDTFEGIEGVLCLNPHCPGFKARALQEIDK